MLYIIIVTVVIILLTFFIWLLYLLTRKSEMIPNIPGLPNNSIFGFTKFIFHKGDSHRHYLYVARTYGPIVQYNVFGNHRVLISDRVLAKESLKYVKSKLISQSSTGINPVKKKLLIVSLK